MSGMIVNPHIYINYNTDAQSYFNECIGSLPSTYKSAINWAVTDLQNSLNWNKIDRFLWFATPNQQNARVSIKNPTSDQTIENSAVWVQNEWYAGDGAGSLNLKYNPVDDGVNFTQNNCGFTIITTKHDLWANGGVIFGAYNAGGYNMFYFNGGKTWSALNGDQKAALASKTAGIHTITRTSSGNINIYKNGVLDSSPASTSAALNNKDLYALAWNYLNAPDSPSNNNILGIIIHSGDVDVSAINNSINGLIYRLNGGFKVTTLNTNISGMPAMDSCLLGKISDTRIGIFGGYSPGEPTNSTNGWWSSADGITWTTESVMPCRTSHCQGKLRDDGYYWMFGKNESLNKLFVMKLNPNDNTWTVVDGDLQAGDLAGLATCQWGFFHKNEMYWALTSGGTTVKIYKSNNGTNWTYVSDMPTTTENFFNCSAFSDGTVIRVTGGGYYDSGTNAMSNFVQNVYESSDNGITWNAIYALDARIRSVWATFFRFEGKDFIISGRNTSTNIYEGGLYYWTGAEWKNTLLYDMSGRHAVAVVNFNNALYMANGYLYNDCYKLEK